MTKIADLGAVNVTFVPRTRSQYFEYASLLHLLPKRVLDIFERPEGGGGVVGGLQEAGRQGEVELADRAGALLEDAMSSWTVRRPVTRTDPDW